MTAHKFPLSQKYIDFINTTKNVTADFLEGTTASGKTTVGAGVKFMRMVSASSKQRYDIGRRKRVFLVAVVMGFFHQQNAPMISAFCAR